MENIYNIYFSEGEEQNIYFMWSLLQASSRTCILDLVDSTEFILFCIYISITSTIVICPVFFKERLLLLQQEGKNCRYLLR